MPAYLISPAEHDPMVKSLGLVSSVPEKFGADVLWVDEGSKAICAVQRKEMSDLIASVEDGRLTKEMAQLQQTHIGVLIVEGRANWTADGVLVKAYTRWTREQHWSLLRSVQSRGVFVEQTDSTHETVARIDAIAKWVAKGEHSALDRRQAMPTGSWGRKTDRDYACWVLQSVEGISRKRAEAILEHFGELPIALTVTRDELVAVPGIGPKMADRIVASFGERPEESH